MRALFLLTIVLVAASADAGLLTGLHNVFSSLGKVFSSTGKSLLGELDNVGGALFDKIKAAGKNLLSQGLQALALNTMGAIKGKREISAIVEKLGSFEKEAKNVIETEIAHFKPLLASVISGFQSVIDTVKDTMSHPEKIVAMIDNITGLHNGIADTILTGLISKLNGVASKFFSSHKRNVFTDAISSIGAKLASMFGPAVQGFKNMVNTTGTALKSAATNLISTVNHSVTDLGKQLSVHGLTALSALKDATADIFQQTMKNAQLETLG